MRPEAKEVKAVSGGAPVKAGRPRFGRHFEGYELGLLSVGIALAFSALAVPRASEPSELPLPAIDRAQLRVREENDRDAAARARREGLSFDVRAVGESIRLLGRALARGEDTTHYQDDARKRARAALSKEGVEPLLRLRAVQTAYFLAALRTFDQRGEQSGELTELAGDFPSHAKLAGWLDARGRCTLDESERRVVFQLRWADLIGQRESLPFSPTLDEWRVYYGLLLRHPEAGASAASPDALRVGYASALARKDPSYPGDLARGVLFYRLGDTQSAASSLRHQLAARADGPYALLTRNYLLYALARGGAE